MYKIPYRCSISLKHLTAFDNLQDIPNGSDCVVAHAKAVGRSRVSADTRIACDEGVRKKCTGRFYMKLQRNLVTIG